MNNIEIERLRKYAQEIRDGNYEGEGLDKWKARAQVLARAVLGLDAELEALTALLWDRTQAGADGLLWVDLPESHKRKFRATLPAGKTSEA